MARVALVTGAARGIGRAIAADLGRDHEIALTYLTTDPAGVLGDVPGALAIAADLTEAGAPARVVAAVIARFGRLDVIVNNAGTAQATPTGGADLSPHRAMYETNLLAPVALVDAALPHLEAGAAIVNISSVNALYPPVSAPVFAATKAGLEVWTRALAKELGRRGIRANAVAPGAVVGGGLERPQEIVDLFLAQTALGRLARPGDVAAAVRFLASDAAAAITGETLRVSAGYRL